MLPIFTTSIIAVLCLELDVGKNKFQEGLRKCLTGVGTKAVEKIEKGLVSMRNDEKGEQIFSSIK